MLTERQEQILDFIRLFQRENGVPPSSREIQRKFQPRQPVDRDRPPAGPGEQGPDRAAGRAAPGGSRRPPCRRSSSRFPSSARFPPGFPRCRSRCQTRRSPSTPASSAPAATGAHQVWALRVQRGLDGRRPHHGRRPGGARAARAARGRYHRGPRGRHHDDAETARAPARAPRPSSGEQALQATSCPSGRLESQGVVVGPDPPGHRHRRLRIHEELVPAPSQTVSALRSLLAARFPERSRRASCGTFPRPGPGDR
jgi:hypothetical protein